MQVKNPTENTLEFQFKGVKYSVGPNASVSVPDAVAEHWKERVHEFIELSADALTVAVEEKVEEVVEVPETSILPGTGAGLPPVFQAPEVAEAAPEVKVTKTTSKKK